MSTIHPFHLDRGGVDFDRELSRSAAERYQVLQALSERRASLRSGRNGRPQLKIIRFRLGRAF